MKLIYHYKKEWPSLCWLAKCSLTSREVHVYHGSQVEVHSDWFCEAVWDGDFVAGDFDRTDVIFGSGARVREEGIIFVPSGSTVDRLQYLKFQSLMLVSNSLACLLKAVEATVDITYPRYFKDFETICKGLPDYKHTVATSVGPVNLLYFNNCQWNGKSLSEVNKPNPVRDFSTFRKYQNFLENSLCKMSENLSSKERMHPYKLAATLSSGYDTSAMVALARNCHLQEAITFKTSRSGLSDSGNIIAEIFNLKPLIVERHAWQSEEFSEVPFIASDAKGEDVYFSGVGDNLNARVLLTGYASGGFWLNDDYLINEKLMRRDQSGLSLTEFRLWKGFIHLPLAFLGAKQVRDIYKIANSEEMAPWDIGGDYNRPIQRRIVEEAGVPRSSFATVKNAASVLLFQRKSFLSPSSLADYHQWLHANAHLWWRQNTLPPHVANALWKVCLPLVSLFVLMVRIVAKVTPPGPLAKIIKPFSIRVRRFARREYLFKFLFPWALEKAKNHYKGAEGILQSVEKHSKEKIAL